MRQLYYLAKASCRGLLYLVVRIRLDSDEKSAYKLKSRQLSSAVFADAIILSYPKSGRTWVESMLSHLYTSRLGLPETRILDFQDDRTVFPGLPYLFFTHDFAHVTGGRWLIPKAGSRGHFRGTPTLFVVRHPIDTAVSMYFQQLRCEQGIKEVGIYEFVSANQGGLPTVIEFLNFWLEESSKIKRCKIVRYEDLSDDTFAAFRDVVRFFGFEFSDEEVRSAVDFADFGNMQKLEKSGQLSDWRFSENAEDDVDKLKVRRGKVKGYTDYFDEEQVAALEAMVADNLNGQFGY